MILSSDHHLHPYGQTWQALFGAMALYEYNLPHFVLLLTPVDVDARRNTDFNPSFTSSALDGQ